MQPVTVDEIRIAIAETYDVIVEPRQKSAYTIFAEAMDRSGFARGTLATENGMSAPLPQRRKRVVATMADMGMGDMAGMNGMSGANGAQDAMKGMNETDPAKLPAGEMTGMDQAPTGTDNVPDMSGMKMDAAPAMNDALAKSAPVNHGLDHHGPGNSAVPIATKSRLDEPGTGLEDTGTRVLRYSDLRSLEPSGDPRPAGREIELHLTGNMERYLWGFDGKKFSEARQAIEFYHGERVRLTLVNDTMMNHPIHLHGMFMELDTGAGVFNPKKHTVNVKPAERLSLDITADALGNWAFHCHILYHMEMGMFRVVSVVDRAADVAS